MVGWGIHFNAKVVLNSVVTCEYFHWCAYLIHFFFFTTISMPQAESIRRSGCHQCNARCNRPCKLYPCSTASPHRRRNWKCTDILSGWAYRMGWEGFRKELDAEKNGVEGVFDLLLLPFTLSVITFSCLCGSILLCVPFGSFVLCILLTHMIFLLSCIGPCPNDHSIYDKVHARVHDKQASGWNV